MKKWLTLLLAAMLLFTVAFAEGNDKITLTEEMGEIVRGGVLTMAKSKGLDAGLNIAKISDCSSDFPVMAQIYEGLLTIDDTGNVAPGLATEWAFAEDGLSMNMKLREDVSFSNGEKFNAEAVAKCLNYYISAECGHVFKGSDLSLIAGVDVVGEYEIKINLSAADAALGLELAGSSGYIMAPSVIDKGEMNTNPIGTGPFVLKEYKEGESIELVANPNYYKLGADGKPLPYLDGIKYIVITDDTTK
ncbi:MAG: ABC transporter substrate-binding protein, partial [Clostridia bacterium]|nr:ABC transporter substrate-binding protein [Clostridia bacterium]